MSARTEAKALLKADAPKCAVLGAGPESERSQLERRISLLGSGLISDVAEF